jgi:hypothetical protein
MDPSARKKRDKNNSLSRAIASMHEHNPVLAKPHGRDRLVIKGDTA